MLRVGFAFISVGLRFKRVFLNFEIETDISLFFSQISPNAARENNRDCNQRRPPQRPQ